MRCGQWFESDEGQLFEVKRGSVAGTIADSIRGANNLRFRCDPCSGQRRRRRLMFYGGLAVLVLLGLAYQQFA